MTGWNEDARKLTDQVTALVGADNGAYPSGNSLVVKGAGETIIIDPSVTVVERGGAGVPVDAVVNTRTKIIWPGTASLLTPGCTFTTMTCWER